MNGILDSLMAKAQAFRPETVEAYAALQVARKLNDTDRLWTYVSLVSHHGLPLVAEAFTNAQSRGPTDAELKTAFEEELAALTTKEGPDEI